MHGAIIPFDSAFFAESALVTGTLQNGVNVLIRARSFARSFNGATRRCRGSHIICIAIFTRPESDMITTRRLTLVTSMIFAIVFLGPVSIIMALDKILEILKGILVKVVLTMVDIALDVFVGERIKNDLGFFIVKCLFIIVIQKFDSMYCFLEVGVKGLGGHLHEFFLATTPVME